MANSASKGVRNNMFSRALGIRHKYRDMCRGEKIIEFAGDTKIEVLANNKV